MWTILPIFTMSILTFSSSTSSCVLVVSAVLVVLAEEHSECSLSESGATGERCYERECSV